MDKVIESYKKTRLFLAMLQGRYGEKLLQKNPFLSKDADKLNDALRVYSFEKMILDEPSCKGIVASLQQLREFRANIPETSFETLKELKDLELKLSKDLQEKAFYDPTFFSELYFLTLPSNQAITNDSRTIKNNRFWWWFEGSKVIDEKSDVKNIPLSVYHGTKVDEFTKFDFKIFPGVYFAENKSYSDWFANGKTVFECYLRVVNPLDLTTFKTDKVTYDEFLTYVELRYGYKLPENTMLKTQSDIKGGMWAWQYLRGGVDWLKYIKSRGEFDGLHFYENNPDDNDNVTKAWMVFSPEQIKTVNSNSTYSLFSKDIRFEGGGIV